jgi:hypothetical protein
MAVRLKFPDGVEVSESSMFGQAGLGRRETKLEP